MLLRHGLHFLSPMHASTPDAAAVMDVCMQHSTPAQDALRHCHEYLAVFAEVPDRAPLRDVVAVLCLAAVISVEAGVVVGGAAAAEHGIALVDHLVTHARGHYSQRLLSAAGLAEATASNAQWCAKAYADLAVPLMHIAARTHGPLGPTQGALGPVFRRIADLRPAYDATALSLFVTVAEATLAAAGADTTYDAKICALLDAAVASSDGGLGNASMLLWAREQACRVQLLLRSGAIVAAAVLALRTIDALPRPAPPLEGSPDELAANHRSVSVGPGTAGAAADGTGAAAAAVGHWRARRVDVERCHLFTVLLDVLLAFAFAELPARWLVLTCARVHLGEGAPPSVGVRSFPASGATAELIGLASSAVTALSAPGQHVPPRSSPEQVLCALAGSCVEAVATFHATQREPGTGATATVAGVSFDPSGPTGLWRARHAVAEFRVRLWSAVLVAEAQGRDADVLAHVSFGAQGLADASDSCMDVLQAWAPWLRRADSAKLPPSSLSAAGTAVGTSGIAGRGSDTPQEGGAQRTAQTAAAVNALLGAAATTYAARTVAHYLFAFDGASRSIAARSQRGSAVGVTKQRMATAAAAQADGDDVVMADGAAMDEAAAAALRHLAPHRAADDPVTRRDAQCVGVALELLLQRPCTAPGRLAARADLTAAAEAAEATSPVCFAGAALCAAACGLSSGKDHMAAREWSAASAKLESALSNVAACAGPCEELAVSDAALSRTLGRSAGLLEDYALTELGTTAVAEADWGAAVRLAEELVAVRQRAAPSDTTGRPRRTAAVAEAELRLASILIERGCSVVSGLRGNGNGNGDDEAATDDAMATELDAAVQILERGSTIAREVEQHARDRGEAGAGSAHGAWARIRAWALELLPAAVASGEPEEDAAGPIRP